jgi:putative transposase
MDGHAPHRKRFRHYHDPGHVHELTFSCFHRWPLLTNDVWREMLAESINRATERHRYRLTAFVFMPEHVHLLVYPLDEAGKIDSLLNAILVDPPQQHAGLPVIYRLPAEWLNEPC